MPTAVSISRVLPAELVLQKIPESAKSFVHFAQALCLCLCARIKFCLVGCHCWMAMPYHTRLQCHWPSYIFTSVFSQCACTGAEERYLDFRPSTVAAASILVAMRMYCTDQALQAAEAYIVNLIAQVSPMSLPCRTTRHFTFYKLKQYKHHGFILSWPDYLGCPITSQSISCLEYLEVTTVAC
jgi:hypothetical protein